MELTEKQQQGIKLIVQNYIDKKPYTIIAGLAGTGKSTLIKFAVSALGIHPDDVAYIAYTGKAAEVLRKKGCPNACTAHKLLYYSNKQPNGKFLFKPRKSLEYPYKIIICDEISMLPKDLWDLLLSHKIYVIGCGDPFQIPPVDKEKDNELLQNPDVFLDEIMRQEEGSEIINLSMDIRNFRPIKYFKGNEVQVLNKNDVVDGMYVWADQILVGTNKKRREINNTMRSMAGRTGKPQIGDKVISLENHWDTLDVLGETALINGTIGYITKIEEDTIKYQIYNGYWIGPIDVYKINIEAETGDIFTDIIIDKKYIDTGEKSLTPQQEYKIYKAKMDAPYTFDYGYAITVHRAQGSQWGKILVFEEKFPFDKEEHARWLYTACTRPEDKMVLIR